MVTQNKKTDEARTKLVQAQLAAFEQIEDEFGACFRFKEDVHGQRRLAAFAVADTVYYLHALWMCECKDRLLGVPQTMGRYEGKRCLDLMRDWQQGQTHQVIAFLQRKLDNLPFAELTRQIAEMQASGNMVFAQRLVHGRSVMLNRGIHLMLAFDAIFALSTDQLMEQVHLACTSCGHTPQQIEQQLASMEAPLYPYLRHPLLAQRNMLVMNALGVTTADGVNKPGHRTARVEPPISPQPSFAEHLVEPELTLITSPY